jgi:hypothetical protein
MTVRHVSSVMPVMGPPRLTPALAIMMSTCPSSATVAANVSMICASSATSHTQVPTRRPVGSSEARAASFLSALRPQMARSAPASARAAPIPRPMPPLPPVTTATRPLRSNMFPHPVVGRPTPYRLDRTSSLARGLARR